VFIKLRVKIDSAVAQRRYWKDFESSFVIIVFSIIRTPIICAIDVKMNFFFLVSSCDGNRFAIERKRGKQDIIAMSCEFA
jgi:hypothetical protein